MKRLSIFFSIFIVIYIIQAPIAISGEKDVKPRSLVIEDFSGITPGIFPPLWRARKEEGKKIYLVREANGNRFLHILDKGESVQIMKEYNWNPHDYPILSWRWRVHKLPKGGNESKGETNDSAGGVYVIFPREWFIPKVLKYVWSTTLKKGDTATAGRGTTKVIVLRGGEKGLGKWLTEKVNVYKDYKRFFDKDVGKIIGVGILTDANATKSAAEADYDDFMIHSLK